MFSGSRQEDVDILGMGSPWQVALCPRCRALTAPSPLTFNRMGGEAHVDDHAMLRLGQYRANPQKSSQDPRTLSRVPTLQRVFPLGLVGTGLCS